MTHLWIFAEAQDLSEEGDGLLAQNLGVADVAPHHLAGRGEIEGGQAGGGQGAGRGRGKGEGEERREEGCRLAAGR